jgi:serine kinase of HPr protein (carbohydrate metabolism regulator)
MNPFEYLKSINESKKDIMIDDLAEKEYNSFIVNRGLSSFQNTILYANEMNRYHHLDSRLQFDFLINIIRKKKRWSKWIKASEVDNLELIKEYYGYSNEKAKSALSLMSNDQIEQLKIRIYKGGKR